jgi:hypothetical protein
MARHGEVDARTIELLFTSYTRSPGAMTCRLNEFPIGTAVESFRGAVRGVISLDDVECIRQQVRRMRLRC